MTTRIRITNEGPENAKVAYYGEDRQFKEQTDILQPGESIEMNVWDGHIPVVTADLKLKGNKFYAVPPATGG